MDGKATLAARKDVDDEVLDLVENLDKHSKNETNLIKSPSEGDKS